MRRSGRQIAAALALTLAVAGCGSSGSSGSGSSSPTITVAPTVTTVVRTQTEAAAAGSIYWGARTGTPGNLAPWSRSAIVSFSQTLGRAPSILHFEAPFTACAKQYCDPVLFPTSAMENIRATGGIPMLSLGSDSTPLASAKEPTYSLKEIAAGKFDSYLRMFAATAAAWGHPLFLRFDWDMNQNWAPWGTGVNGNTPADYIAAWRHVHDLFTAAGAHNVTWVWCPSAQPAATASALSAYYPGAAYVDWTCLTGITAQNDTQYTGGFSSLFGSSYAALAKLAPGKPVMIGEVGTYLTGSAMAAWISNMFTTVATRFPAIRAVVWADIDDPGSGTPLLQYSAARNAFATSVRGTAYASNAFGHLSASPIQPPA